MPRSQYEIHCSQILLAIATSQAVLQDLELQPSITDEEFFGAREFRRTRFRLSVPHCRFVGLAGLELLQGKSCRARVIELQSCALETVFNRDKPVNLQAHRLLTVRDLLAIFKIPLQFDQFSVTNGQVRFGERLEPGQAPRFLTFDAVRLTAQALVYPAPHGAVSPMYATAKFMNAGPLTLNAQIPLAEPEFTFRYSGSLGAMDLERLNPFLEIAAHCRVKSGLLRELSFSAGVIEGHALGELRGLYQDLDLEFLPRNGTGTEIAEPKSFLVHELVLRRNNLPKTGKPLAIGRIDYSRKLEESSLHFDWFALRSGMMDVLGFSKYVKQ